MDKRHRGEAEMSEAFMSDVRTMELFYRICLRYRIQRQEDKIRLLRELVKRKKMKYLRDIKPFLEGKKVLKIGFNKEPK